LIDNITPVIIAKDAQNTIKDTLDSLVSFQEVILYLNNTTDNTQSIAKNYTNVKIIDGDFLGFGKTKNKAASFAKNDWILSLDSDEVLSSSFITSLSKINLDNSTIYTILRTNYYKKTQIKYCWGDDIIVRLYNKHKTSFCNNMVHEYIIEDNYHIKQIEGVVNHYPYQTISDFIIKINRYSTLFANENKGKKNSSPLKSFFKGMFNFFKTYILKRGFLDGYAGLLISISNANGAFYKYLMLYEENNNDN
jgi:glycosyltransferase involved in cell wall biosynthesis